MNIGGKTQKSVQSGKVNTLQLFKFSVIDESTYNQFRKKSIITNIVTNENYIMKLSSKEDKYFAYPFATYMRVKERYISIDNQQSSFLLEYYNGQAIAETQFSDSVLNSKDIKALLGYGIMYDEKSSADLIRYLMISKSQAQITNVYYKLGFEITPTENRYYGYKIYTDSDETVTDKYIGCVDLTPRGDLKKWTAMVRTQVLGNTPLELALVLGFASPVLALLNDSLNLGSLVFNYCNTSSKGKTTAAMLATSAFSNPAADRGTLITYNATENAIIESLSSMNSCTVGIDEVGMNSVKSLSRLLYSMDTGTSKRRLDGNASLKPSKRFCSVVISTAEYSLLNNNIFDGLNARVFEINDQLTTCAENSNAIKKVVMSNYGLAGDRFIKYLIDNLEHDKSNLLDVYYEMEGILSDMTVEYNGNLRSRIVSKLSVILTTAELLDEANILEQPLDMYRIAEYLSDIVGSCCSQLTPDEKLLNIVAEEIEVNRSHFSRKGEPLYSSRWGRIDDNDSYIIVNFFQNRFEREMLDNGFLNYSQAIKILKEKGRLKHETGRDTRRIITKDKSRLPCYSFVIPKAVTKKQ